MTVRLRLTLLYGALFLLSGAVLLSITYLLVAHGSGSVVMTQAVTLQQCAVSHGNLSVAVSADPQVSQPNALSGGQTVVTQPGSVDIQKAPGKVLMLQGGASLSDVVKALNAIGATPQDLLAILQAMKASGALRAELEII